MDTHTSSATKLGANGRISAEYEAHAKNAGTRLLVCALYADGKLKTYAHAVSREKSAQRRHAAARRYARKYVPRGRDRLEFMTEWIEAVADRYRQREPGQLDASTENLSRRDAVRRAARRARVPTDGVLLSRATYAFVVDAPGSGDRTRRVRASHFDRLRDGAAMVVRRGADRCLNLGCRQAAGAGDYCLACATDADVQRDHNLRRKAIDELWTAVLSRGYAASRAA